MSDESESQGDRKGEQIFETFGRVKIYIELRKEKINIRQVIRETLKSSLSNSARKAQHYQRT